MVTLAPPSEIVVVIILLGFAGIPLACLALIVWLMRKSPESFFLRKQRRTLYRRVVNTHAQELLSCPHFFEYLKPSKNVVVPDECLNCPKLIECVKHRERRSEERRERPTLRQ